MVLVIEGMHFVYDTVNYSYYLTIEMHINQIAKRALDMQLLPLRLSAVQCDFHFDDTKYVPLAKIGEQRRRDNARRIMDTPYNEHDDINDSVKRISLPPRNWNSVVLGNRELKRKIVNAVAAFTLLRAVKIGQNSNRTGLCSNVAPPVRIFGALISVSHSICEENLQGMDLVVKLLLCGGALLLLRAEDCSDVEKISRTQADSRTCLIVE